MVNGNNKIADIVATEMREIRALTERMFGELIALLEKFDDIGPTEMGEMCALIERMFGELIVRLEKFYERMFGELNASLGKFNEQILKLKKCIESSKDQYKGEKMTEYAMNSSSYDHENSSMLQVLLILLF